jgi:hypothetical protein
MRETVQALAAYYEKDSFLNPGEKSDGTYEY